MCVSKNPAGNLTKIDITSVDQFLSIVKKGMYIITSSKYQLGSYLTYIERIERDPQEIGTPGIKVATYFYSSICLNHNEMTISSNILEDPSDDPPDQYDIKPTTFGTFNIAVFNSFEGMILRLPVHMVVKSIDLLNSFRPL